MAQRVVVRTPRRFLLLRFVAVALRVLAWVMLLLAVLAAGAPFFASLQLADLLAQTGDMGAFLLDSQWPWAAASLVTGLLLFVFLYTCGEAISLRLAVEENTRLTAALLMKMEQEYNQGR